MKSPGFYVALSCVTALYGINREYRLEIAAISINWTALIVSGILLCRFFIREEKGGLLPPR